MHRMEVSILTIGMFVVATSASADAIHITSGDLVGGISDVNVHLESPDRQFSFTGFGQGADGTYGPGFCQFCVPGSTQSLDVRYSGIDFGGTASIDGETTTMGLSDYDAAADIRFAGEWTAPAYTGQPTAIATAPFTFTGSFITPADMHNELIPLVGHGIARITVEWNNRGEQGWDLKAADYRFSSAPAATPEPASLILLGTGLAGMAFRRRRART